MDGMKLDESWDDEFDPMLEAWDGRRLYGAEEAAKYRNADWERGISYALPAAANMLLDVCEPMRQRPANPEEILCSETLALSAFASWIGVDVTPIIAVDDDMKARTMVLASVAMSKTPTCGSNVAGDDRLRIQLDTKGSPVFDIWEPVYAAHMLAAAAETIPEDVPLDRIAYVLDMQVLGAGRWREAAKLLQK